LTGLLLYVNEDEPRMPAMMLPATHKYDYTATIRIVVSDKFDASEFVDVPVKVSYARLLLVRFQGQTVITTSSYLG